MHRSLILATLFGLLTSTQVWAQATVENPTANSTQSGISLISGWVCNATKIEVMVDSLAAVQIPYGTPRGDAQVTCNGRLNTGFGALINWNDLGDGPHVVKVLADGQQIASIPISVVSFGVSFLRNTSHVVTTAFGGCVATLQWRESQQNFAIAATELCFQPFLGRWEFVTKKPSGDEVNHYTFTSIEKRPSATTDDEVEVVTGTDLDHGGLVLLTRVRDLLPTSVPYDFAVASLLSSRCEILIFRQSGPGTVQGIGTSFPADPATGCRRYPSPSPAEYALTGTRTAAALSTSLAMEDALHGLPQPAVNTGTNSEFFSELLENGFQGILNR